MHGASSDSLHALTEALGAAVEGGADASRIGDDLFAVAEVLRREPSLRRVATDLSVTPEAKSDLMRRIFGDQLDPASTDLVAAAAGRRWAATRHLPDALEHLGVVAVVRGAEQKGKADELENELFALERLVSGSPELRDALSDPARSVADKRRLLRDLLDGQATSATVRLAEQAVSRVLPHGRAGARELPEDRGRPPQPAGRHRPGRARPRRPGAAAAAGGAGRAVLPSRAPQRRRRPRRPRRHAGVHRGRSDRRHGGRPPRRRPTAARRLTVTGTTRPQH